MRRANARWMGRRRLVIWALAAGITAVVLLFGGVLSGRPHPNPLAVLAANAGVSPEQADLGRLFAGFSTGNTAGVVHRLERRVARMPHDGNALVVLALGDALLNLGRYPQAFKMYDRIALKAPGIASFSRVANARELIGRPTAAVAADKLALEADATIPEQIAWTMTQIGNVNFNMGRLGAAAKAYRRALRRFPGYVHAEAG